MHLRVIISSFFDPARPWGGDKERIERGSKWEKESGKKGELSRWPIPFHLSSGHFSLSLFPPPPLTSPGGYGFLGGEILPIGSIGEPCRRRKASQFGESGTRAGEGEKVEKDRGGIDSRRRRKKLSLEKKEGHDHDLSVNREEKEEKGGKERKWKGKRKSSLSPFPASTNGLWKWRAGIFFVGDGGE